VKIFFRILLIFITIICFACNTNKPAVDTNNKDRVLESLCRQRIPNSSKVIYTFSYEGWYAWSSSDNGKVILDSTEVFTWEKSRNKLPFYITSIDMDLKQINGIEFIEPELSNVKGTYKIPYGDMEIVVKQYISPRGSDMGLSYRYKNFYESQDSIFFENLMIDGFGLNVHSPIGFKKGIFTAEEDSCGYVNRFNFSIISQYPLWERMRSKSDAIDIRDSKELFGRNQIDLPPLSTVYLFNIVIIPDSTSKKQKVSDYGVYKRIK
jgi:hypothetical protein